MYYYSPPKYSYLLQPRPLVVTHCGATPTPWASSCSLVRADCAGSDPLESFLTIFGVSIVTACHAHKTWSRQNQLCSDICSTLYPGKTYSSGAHRSLLFCSYDRRELVIPTVV